MPDHFPDTLAAAIEAFNQLHVRRGWNKPAPWWAEEAATAILDAAAPLQAENAVSDGETEVRRG